MTKCDKGKRERKRTVTSDELLDEKNESKNRVKKKKKGQDSKPDQPA